MPSAIATGNLRNQSLCQKYECRHDTMTSPRGSRQYPDVPSVLKRIPNSCTNEWKKINKCLQTMYLFSQLICHVRRWNNNLPYCGMVMEAWHNKPPKMEWGTHWPLQGQINVRELDRTRTGTDCVMWIGIMHFTIKYSWVLAH